MFREKNLNMFAPLVLLCVLVSSQGLIQIIIVPGRSFIIEMQLEKYSFTCSQTHFRALLFPLRHSTEYKWSLNAEQVMSRS